MAAIAPIVPDAVKRLPQTPSVNFNYDCAGVGMFNDVSFQARADLHVYLTTEPESYGTDPLYLGALKATDGAFNYDVPAGTDVSRFKGALVWCRQFSVLFAIAPLTRSA